MKVTMISHASVLIEDGPVALLADPWFMGEVFNESWSLLCPPALTPDALQGVTHIWISHEHPDHLHFPTLKSIPAEQKATITLLYQRHFSTRVYEALSRLGFGQVIELPLNRWFDLGGDVAVMCCSVGTVDSLLAVRTATGTVLNVNDCVIGPGAARVAARRIGPVDILLTQFSIANWAGNPDQTEVAAPDQVLNRARLYIDSFKPKVTIPFASFVYFSHDENRHMNGWINTPARVIERLDGAPTRLQFLYNGDSWSSQEGFCLYGDPLELFQADFEKIAHLPYRSHPSCSREELVELGQRLVDEVRPRFPRFLLRGVAPVHFYIEDLNAALCFDLRRGTVEAEERARSQCDIALHSQALWFAFKFTWGFGTLEVSGRYTRINPKVDKRALYLCHLYSTDIHFQGLPRRLAQRRVWSFCWTKRHEVLNRLLGK
ncbi:MAG TPA: MBL fold metallo-hydrolase [Blastocatellia bacterium]|nr:MBL fold metallo-hydrolase [Blastocatellia bacterium]